MINQHEEMDILSDNKLNNNNNNNNNNERSVLSRPT